MARTETLQLDIDGRDSSDDTEWRRLPPPPARLLVKDDAELLEKLEEAAAYAESGHAFTAEEVFERLDRKYGFQA